MAVRDDASAALYAELFGDADGDDAAAAAAAAPVAPVAAPPMPAEDANYVVTLKNGKKAYRADHLRIVELKYASEDTYGEGDRRFVVFIGKSPNSAGGKNRKWKGVLPKPDMLHEYSVLYTLVADGCGGRWGPPPKIASVFAVQSTRRVPLDVAAATIILRRVCKLDPTDARQTADAVVAVTRGSGGLGDFLRTFGGDQWLKTAEAQSDYFRDWYVEAMCPPYEQESIKYLPDATICRIARIAVAEPWKLCLWWMTGEVLMEELELAPALELARREGGDFPDSARAAVAAYRGRPFADARGRGDSWVDKAWFDDTTSSEHAPPPSLLRDCLRHKVAPGVEVRKNEGGGGYVERVYCAGDIDCEKAVADLVVQRTVTSAEGGSEVKMNPRCAWWPWSEKNAKPPNAEQTAAIDRLTRSRLGVICGVPGGGKTWVLKSLASAFLRGVVVGVAFTGMAAENLHAVTGYGVTAHTVVNEWRCAGGGAHRYSERKVLIIDEASAMSNQVLHALLLALPNVTRIYLAGDKNQMPPPDGGSSVLEALIRRYGGTPVVSELRTSMRVTDPTGAFLRDLMRICEFRVDGEFEWSDDAAAGFPFVFLRRGKDAAENVGIIRAALEKAGVDPDRSGNRAQVMVGTNEERREMSMHWWMCQSRRRREEKKDAVDAAAVKEAASLFGEDEAAAAEPAAKKPRGGDDADGDAREYAEHEFSVGERVMFLRNQKYEYTPRGSKFTVGRVMNGTCGTIAEIFDEPQKGGDEVVIVHDTRDVKADATARRWMKVPRVPPNRLY